MTLTHLQKEFLLNTFFVNDSYAGWREIAEKLIDTGSCIVAGKDRIWWGGLGNFIKAEPAKNAVDCTLLTFNVEDFVKNTVMYSYTKEAYLNNLNKDLIALQTQIKEIEQLKK